jgi:branched-chain amino acid transport system permease protein
MSKPRTWLQNALYFSLISGVVVVALSLVGMVVSFSKRGFIGTVITEGQLLLFLTVAVFGYIAAAQTEKRNLVNAVVSGLIIGFVSSVFLMILVLLVDFKPLGLRSMFVNASPALVKVLTFGKKSTEAGFAYMLLLNMLSGLFGALIEAIPGIWGSALSTGTLITILVGLLADIWKTFLPKGISKFFFAGKGFSIKGFVITLVVLVGFIIFWHFYGNSVKSGYSKVESKQPKGVKVTTWLIAALIFLLLPKIIGSYLSEVLDLVGLYIIMGLGLNIVVGFAGMLDLGYVAFFAIGAYTMGVLSSQELGLFHLTFWEALPFSILFAVIAGVLLGIPVLGMRGDYLAIVTMGFGEIIRLLVLSDALKPILGGAQGLTRIARPTIGPVVVKQPTQFYYLILAGIVIAWYVATALKDSKLGRAWMAMREDEDVAQAMGMNLVGIKLLAFGTGAALSGLSGAIFAAKLNSMVPHSFNILISIYVLSLIIVGGVGSNPGVVVGSLALIGTPELLREFAEYRMMIYGAVLVAMMIFMPEGLWPEPARKRELHGEREEAPMIETGVTAQEEA